MADNKTIWFTTGLMQHNEVSKVVSLADLDQVFHHVTTSVDTKRVRKNQLELLLEGNKSLRWVSTSSNEKFRISIFGRLILIIDMRTRQNSVFIS
jgi:hypothetical protein